MNTRNIRRTGGLWWIGAGITAFFAVTTALTVTTPANTPSYPQPAPCQVSASYIIASGDAARLNTPATLYALQPRINQAFVCTDGTLVHVTGYGNSY